MLRGMVEALSHSASSAGSCDRAHPGGCLGAGAARGVREVLDPGRLRGADGAASVRRCGSMGDGLADAASAGAEDRGRSGPRCRACRWARRFSRETPWRNPLLRLDQMPGPQRPSRWSARTTPPRFAGKPASPSRSRIHAAPCPPSPRRSARGSPRRASCARGCGWTSTATDGEVSLGGDWRWPARAANFRIFSRLLRRQLDRIDPATAFRSGDPGGGSCEELSEVQTGSTGGAERRGAGAAHRRLGGPLRPRRDRRAALPQSHVPERREEWHGAPGAAGPCPVPVADSVGGDAGCWDPHRGDPAFFYAVPLRPVRAVSSGAA